MIIEEQPAWAPHLRSRPILREASKRRFVDPSLAVAALRVSPKQLRDDLELFWLLFESLVIRDLRVYAQTADGEVLHYRDNTGLEVDTVVTTQGGAWGGGRRQEISRTYELDGLVKTDTIQRLNGAGYPVHGRTRIRLCFGHRNGCNVAIVVVAIQTSSADGSLRLAGLSLPSLCLAAHVLSITRGRSQARSSASAKWRRPRHRAQGRWEDHDGAPPLCIGGSTGPGPGPGRPHRRRSGSGSDPRGGATASYRRVPTRGRDLRGGARAY